MHVVAVAGGTGGIGRTIVEEIQADDQFEVVVLSRKVETAVSQVLGARILAVDYSDVDSLVSLLQNENIHTLISTLGGRAPPEQELALIEAAEKSTVTKRYIPSVWGVKYSPELSWFPIAASKLKAFAALENTHLEWTVVSNGFFLDYWGLPKIKSYMTPMVMVLDVAGKTAAIPGSGDTPVTFTYTVDVAKFTAKLLTLNKWETESFVIGDRLTWNEFTAIAGDVKGENFDVSYDPPELLKSGKIIELPSHKYAYDSFPKEALQGMLAQFGLLFDEGVFDFQPEQTLNDLFPEIKPKSAREVLEIGWKN